MAKRKEFFDSYRGLGACVICLYHYLNTFGLEGVREVEYMICYLI